MGGANALDDVYAFRFGSFHHRAVPRFRPLRTSTPVLRHAVMGDGQALPSNRWKSGPSQVRRLRERAGHRDSWNVQLPQHDYEILRSIDARRRSELYAADYL